MDIGPLFSHFGLFFVTELVCRSRTGQPKCVSWERLAKQIGWNVKMSSWRAFSLADIQTNLREVEELTKLREGIMYRLSNRDENSLYVTVLISNNQVVDAILVVHVPKTSSTQLINTQ